ncbi:MAG: DUF3025 domain-containing protein [Gammaproteobacteria bacterium]|nr:DUF3025 domain-containing protein [Gammaproteobacteria bacterium]
MNLSSEHFDPDMPYWQDYLPYLEQLAGTGFPGCGQLNGLMKPGLRSHGGHAIRFVPSEQLDDDGYEHRIYTTGQVSTRKDNWHDLFNALVWMRFPGLKVAMNALHYQAIPDQTDGRRGPLRDALTLFDECGVIVLSDSAELLNQLAQRRWHDAFLGGKFSTSVQIFICGHAMLEKYLSPYKSMTAKALLLHVDPALLEGPRHEILRHIDQAISARMLRGELITTPPSLAPLPLAGVPGWWPRDEQQESCFYTDQQVFRPAPRTLVPALVNDL